MYQSRHARHAFILSVLALMLCFCMLIGTTYAWFTDSVTSDNNEIVAGNLDVALDYYKDGAWTTVEGATDIFDPDARWEPGRTEVVYLKASNIGTLALKYVLAVNLNGETAATNVKNETFKLSDYLMFDIVADKKPGDFATRADAIAATTDAKTLQESLIGNINEDGLVKGELEPVGEGNVSEKYVAVVLWMPTDVDNSANTKPGTAAPTLDLGVSINATQFNDEDEKDSFDDEGYDAGATLPSFSGKGSYTITQPSSSYMVEVRSNATNSKIASFEVPASALADGVTKIDTSVEETDEIDANIIVKEGETMKAYEIEVIGLKDDNTDLVTVQIKLAEAETEIDKRTIAIYHVTDNGNTELIDSNTITYVKETGYVIFKTASFSPYAIVYTEGITVGGDDTTEPEAIVEDITDTYNEEIVWGSYGQWSPNKDVDPNPSLDVIYSFKAPHTKDNVLTSAYAGWYCDFYVKLDCALGANEIFLGGNYGIFGWVGFHNGDIELPANTEIALLGSVTNNPWTYEQVVKNVGEFLCGVSDVDDALEGATFTVTLRLTNPDNEAQTIDAAVIEHVFEASAPAVGE